jgi:hypothetical protein
MARASRAPVEIETVPTDPGRTRRLTVLAVSLLLAGVLLALAIPRTAATLLTTPSALVLRKLQNLEPVSVAELQTVADDQDRGLALVEDGRLATDLGLAELLMAERLADGDPMVAVRLENAVQSLKRGLSAAPGNPYAWARLAYAEARLRGWTPLALQALRLALLTASYEPRLLWSRLRLCFLAWPYMAEEDREIVYQQIRMAWQDDPQKLTQLADTLERVNVVRAALLRLPGAAERFEELLAEGA